ncbi:MAG: FecR domain-containing protein [Acidobacteriota bacterium]|nr:FecR domain-containing protein [Acidobacteriota bacterium]
MVNYIEGQATVDGRPLRPGAGRLLPNQLLETTQGYVEVPLAPGAFLRVGNGSQVRMISTSVADTRIEVVRGEVMIEAADFVKDSNLRVQMGGATIRIDHRGLYDFNATAQSIAVLDGKARVDLGEKHATLDKEDEVLLASDKPLRIRQANFKALTGEPLYAWSRGRSQYEAGANRHEAHMVAAYGGWYGPGWYWDPYWASYAFLPGWGMSYSPFGWGFYSPVFFHGYAGWGYSRPYYRGAVGAFRGGFHAGHGR